MGPLQHCGKTVACTRFNARPACRQCLSKDSIRRRGPILDGQEPLSAASVMKGGEIHGEGFRVMWYGRISSRRGGLTASVAAAALVLAGVPTASFAIDALGSERKRALFEANKAIYEAKWGPWVPHGYRA